MITTTKGGLQERLRAERERLGYSLEDFAKLVGATRAHQVCCETGRAVVDASSLEIWAKHGMDVLYVVTGKAESAQDNFDVDLVKRIIAVLDQSARQAGRRWDAERLALTAIEVYDHFGLVVLGDEGGDS